MSCVFPSLLTKAACVRRQATLCMSDCLLQRASFFFNKNRSGRVIPGNIPCLYFTGSDYGLFLNRCEEVGSVNKSAVQHEVISMITTISKI